MISWSSRETGIFSWFCLRRSISLNIMFLDRYINVSHIAKTIGVDLLHFISSILVFGCDFIPVISNLPLTCQALKSIFELDRWIFDIYNKVILLKDNFMRCLSALFQVYRTQRVSNIKAAHRGCQVCMPSRVKAQKWSPSFSTTLYLYWKGYFFVRGHKYNICNLSNQYSENNLGVNNDQMKDYSSEIQSSISVEIEVHIIDYKSFT